MNITHLKEHATYWTDSLSMFFSLKYSKNNGLNYFTKLYSFWLVCTINLYTFTYLYILYIGNSFVSWLLLMYISIYTLLK